MTFNVAFGLLLGRLLGIVIFAMLMWAWWRHRNDEE